MATNLLDYITAELLGDDKVKLAGVDVDGVLRGRATPGYSGIH